MRRYAGGEDFSPKDRCAALLAQLSAYDWWQHERLDPQRAARIGVHAARLRTPAIFTSTGELATDAQCCAGTENRLPTSEKPWCSPVATACMHSVL